MTPPTARPALIQALLDQVRNTLSLHRQSHVMGAAHTVTMLAARHGLDIERAMLAGLLHDLYKEWPADRIRGEVKRLGGAIPEDDLAFPHLWHGYCAALVGREQWGLDAPDLFEAVMLHTTADAGVGPLTRALFVADFAEPGRSAQATAEVLEAACRDLDEGFRQALLAKTRHVRSRGKRLSIRAVRALQAYLPPEAAEEFAAAER